MSRTFVEGPIKTFPISGALIAHRRVTRSGDPLVLSYAGDAEAGLGTLNVIALADDEVGAVRLFSAPGTQIMVAAGAIPDGSVVYAAANGKVAAAGTVRIGTAVSAAGADGDYIEVVCDLEIATGPALHAVQAVTSNTTLTAAQSGRLVHNTGAAGAVTVSLPAAPAVGTFYRFGVGVAQELRIDPANGDSVVINGAVQTAGKYITADDEAESCELVYIGSNRWLARHVTGTWTVEA